MKFVLLSTLYPNQKQTTRALYNQRLFEAIRDSGHDIEIIAPIPYFPGKKHLPPKTDILNDVRLQHPRFFYTPGILIHHHWRFYQRAVSHTLHELIARSDPKSLHIALGFTYPDAVAMAPICQQYNLDYSVFVLGSDFRVRMKQNKFKQRVINCLNEAPKIFCPGKALKEDMSKAGIENTKIKAFNNGVNQSIFYSDHLETPVSPPSILFVGNLVSVKAPERLITAFSLLIQSTKRTDIHLDMVGDGAERGKLEHLIRELSIEDRVTLHGRLAPEQIAEMMRNAACLCLSSRSEGMPNVIVEALACGCPVIATNVGEVSYLLKEGINGSIVNIEQASETQITTSLAEKMDICLSHIWNRQEIAKKMSSYTWQNAAQTIINEVDK